MDKEYYAFISYSHKDEEWAKWLQHEFEHYHLPTTLNGSTDLPDKFRPIFRDIDELSGGELKPQISHALRSSAYLVIICSPNSAKSSYVDEEIREFIEIGEKEGINNISNIFPFIIEGLPHSNEDPDKECFPDALRDLPSEIIAGDVTKHGREHAFVKILSGTLHHLNIGFSMLWNQFERDRIEEERREREKRDRLLLLESRYLSEKALDLAPKDSRLAKMLVLRALPKDMNNPEDRPYCPEAESALRKICNYKSEIIKTENSKISFFYFCSLSKHGVFTFSDGTVKILDLESGLQKEVPLDGIEGRVLYAKCSNTGKKIALYCKDGNLVLLNSRTENQIERISIGLQQSFPRLVFSHNEKFLVALYNDGKLKIWNVEDGSLVHEIQASKSNDLAIDKNDRWIALANIDFAIEVFDLNNAKRIKKIPQAHPQSLTSIDFNPDGRRVLSASFDGKFKIWDWMNGETLLSNTVGAVKKLLVPSNEGPLYGEMATALYSSKFSRDGKYIVTASQDGGVRIWDAITGEQKGTTLIGHTGSVNWAFFNHDDSCIISDSSDGTIRIWELSPKVPYKIVGRAKNIPFEEKVLFNNYRLEFHHSKDVSIMNTETKLVIKKLKGHKSDVSCAIFCPDGTIIATTAYDGTVRLWDFKTGEQIGPTLEGHTEKPRMAAFSPDGRFLVTGSVKELKVWDTYNHIQMGPDLTFYDDFFRVMFTDDGRGIITETNMDYDVLFDWIPLQELIDRAQGQVSNRQFTKEEKMKYYLD